MSEYQRQRLQSADYIRKHRLQELFAHLLQLIVYAEPEDPRAFLRAEVERLRHGDAPTDLFSDNDLATMFNLIDVTKRRSVTKEQLRNAYRNLSTTGGGDNSSSSSAAAARGMEEEDAMIAEVADEHGRVGPEGFRKVIGEQLRTRNEWKQQ